MLSRQFLFKGALLSSLAASTLALAGCMTETAYAPATGHGYDRQGYSDHQIEPNRFVVSFAGNGYTPRDTVERYLLFRAAQLTVEHGDDYFIMVDRNTDKRTSTYGTSIPFGPGPWGGWGPSWSFYGRGFGGYGRGGFGWRSWDPYFGGPWGGDSFDVQQIQQFEAHAEILTGKGPKPANNVRAFDAHAVIESIGPTIVPPDAKKR